MNEIYKNIKQEKELYFELGRTLLSQNKFRKAIEHLLEAKGIAKKTGEEWKIFYLLGEGYKNISNTRDAFDYFIQAAVNTNQFKEQCYEQAKKLINPSTAKDLQKWFQEKFANLNFDSLNEEDKLAIDELSSYFISLAKNDQYVKQQDNKISQKEQEAILEEINGLIKNNLHKNAQEKIEEALTREPSNIQLLFLKIRILIEGQIDTNGAVVLFLDDEYGYRMNFKDEEIIKNLHRILHDNPEKGNTWFFAAFIARLLRHDREELKIWLEKAEQFGLENEQTYPSLGLQLLKGEIAEEEDKKEEAGVNYLEAAKFNYWQSNYREASKYFEKAIKLNPKLNSGYYYLADTLLLLSYQPEPPYNKQELIESSFKILDKSPEKIVKTKDEAWHYIVAARVHEINFKFRKENFYEEYWQSILFVERALIHNSRDSTFWNYLGQYHRLFGLEVNSKEAFVKAESLSENNDLLKEELIILQINMGDYEQPIAYLLEMKEKGKVGSIDYQYYHKSWEGFILFHQGSNYKEAISLFDAVIKEVSTLLFARHMKMICHWHSHELDKAKKEAAAIIDLDRKYSYLKENSTFSWAYFISGQPEKAISMVENYCLIGGIPRDAFSLSQFYLVTGKIEMAEDIFAEFIKQAYNKRLLNEFLQNLNTLTFQVDSDKFEYEISVNELRSRIEDWKTNIQKQLACALEVPLTLEGELKKELNEKGYKKGSIAYIALQAGLGGLCRDQKKLPEAYRIYQSLTIYNNLFPEAQIALEQIENEVFSKAISDIKNSADTDAIHYLNDFEITSPVNGTKKMMLLALAFFKTHEKEKSLKYIKDAVWLMKNNIEIQQSVFEEITVNAYSAKETWEFGSFLKTSIQKLKLPEARELMESMIENFWNVLSSKGGDLYPVVTPIVVEISHDLVTSEEVSAKDWYVLDTLIPSMRERVHLKFGVKPSGVRIRYNEGDMEAGTYIFMLDEVPLILGKVYPGKLFVTDNEKNLEILSITGETGKIPLSGKHSLWVDAKYKETLKNNHISFWKDPFDYLIGHLEAFLISNLETFIDTQFCDDYLNNYIYENNGKDLEETGMAKSISHDSTLLLLFKQVLQGLAREHVPIKNNSQVIRSFMAAIDKHTEANELIQHIRMDLLIELPVNTSNLQAFILPSETEKNIRKELMTEQGKTFLAMLPENCQEALAEIREIVQTGQDLQSLMLLTNDTQLRVHLRKLMELEFPNILVAAKEEILEK